jgi:hypothetical protein
MGTRTRIVLIALVGLWVRFGGPAAAARVPSMLCDDVCTGEVDCDATCFATQMDLENGWPTTTCQDYNPSADCCGDGMCGTDERCTGCVDDCGDHAFCEYTCTYNSDCDPGYVCNAARQCVVNPDESNDESLENPPGRCDGTCTYYGDCCGTDRCYNGKCAAPTTDECSDAPSCTTSNDCWGVEIWDACGGPYYAMYCDPGIGRCQFLDWGYGCVDGNWYNACQ